MELKLKKMLAKKQKIVKMKEYSDLIKNSTLNRDKYFSYIERRNNRANKQHKNFKK
jgi:hypothetical protein